MDKILIVDDSILQGKILAEILRESYIVEVICNSMDVVYKAEEFLPSLILLDVIMPGKDGFEVLEDLKNSDTLKAVPVIIITSLSDTGSEERGLLLGAVDYITKPFNKLIVKARIKTHIQLYNYRRAIEEMAMIDALTGLPNRRSYNERIAKEWGRAIKERYPISIAMLDIDYFKQYNDNFGHPAGDLLLQKIASVISGHLNRGAGFAARYGGEEFIFLFPHADRRRAVTICESIRAAVEKMEEPSLRPSGEPSHVTVSLGGVTVIPQPAQLYADYVEYTDRMLYQAKKVGRNRVMWASSASEPEGK